MKIIILLFTLNKSYGMKEAEGKTVHINTACVPFILIQTHSKTQHAMMTTVQEI